MSFEPIDPHPTPEFTYILSQVILHTRTVSKWVVKNRIMQDETFEGTDFKEDFLLEYHPSRWHGEVNEAHADRWLTVSEFMLWSPGYLSEVAAFIKANRIDPVELDNIWLLRCRVFICLRQAIGDEFRKKNYESVRTKELNFINNHILPFIEQLQGDALYTAGSNHVHSVLFKANKPGVKTLKLEGRLANMMYSNLQKMASHVLKVYEGFTPDLLTNRFRKAIGDSAVRIYTIMLQSGIFKKTKTGKPTSDQLRIIQELIDLSANEEGMLDSIYIEPGSSVVEQLRKFF